MVRSVVRPWTVCVLPALIVQVLACSSAPSNADAAQGGGARGSTTPVGGAGMSSPTHVAPDATAGTASEAPTSAAGTSAAVAGAAAAVGGAGAPAAVGGAGAPAAAGMAAAAAAAGSGGQAVQASSEMFVLIPVGFPMAGDELTFPESANPPTNASPEFEWKGVPAGAKSLALVFRDLGNGAVKWLLWDIPPTVMHVPPNVSKTAMPAEVAGASQLGSLNNQGYAGPGTGARQYDFTLWALDVDKLPGTSRLTTAQIFDNVLPMHDVAKTAPVLVRNTRNE